MPEIADTLLKSWMESIVRQRDGLVKEQTSAYHSGSSSTAANIGNAIKATDDLLLKIYMLSKSDQPIPDDVLANIQKEIFNQKS